MNEDILQEIRSKTDIVETIRSYIPVIKKGKSYVAVCPFHDDHSPSMSISPEKQIYKCFVCGSGGNVFSFVKDFEKISFNEAVVQLANKAHVDLGSNFQQTKPIIDPKIQSYYDTLNEYLRFIRYTLASEDGKLAKDYLHKRGLSDEVIQKFECGYNPADHKASDYLQAKEYSIENCTQTNITRVNEYGTKDVFEKRVIFPIHNPQGQVVGFSARALNSEESAKYINSSETAVYQKGLLLYNYHRAKASIKLNDTIILVEGVMDAIAFDRAGHENVVASLGTALTKEQIRLIKTVTQNVTLSYDADEAGQLATQKIGRLLLDQGFKVNVILNRLGKDADEILLTKGSEALNKLVASKVSFAEYLFESSLNRLDLSNYSQKKEFAKLMMLELSRIKDSFDRSHLLQKLVDTTGFSADQLNLLSPQNNTSKTVQTNFKHKNSKQNEIEDWAEKEILGQMLVSQQAMQTFRKELGYFINELYQKIALKIMHYYRHHDSIVVADFINVLEDDVAQECVTQIVESDIYYNSYSEKALMDAILQVKINTIDAQIDQFRTEHKEELALDESPSLMEHYQLLLSEKRVYQKRKEESHGK